MIEYVVVNVAEKQKIVDSFGTKLSTYRGLDRDPWERLDDMYYAQTLPEEIACIRRNSFGHRVGNFSPGTVESLYDVSRLLDICNTANTECEVIGITVLGPLYLTEELPYDQKNCLGIDCYVDGFGSLLALGVFENPDVFRDFHHLLNRNGLFMNIEAMRSYVKVYCEIAESAGLEPIDSQQDICLYAVLRP